MRDALIAGLYVVVLAAGVRAGLALALRPGSAVPPADRPRGRLLRRGRGAAPPGGQPGLPHGSAVPPADGRRGRQGLRWRPPLATLAALVTVGVPTLLQFTVVPSLLHDLERDRAAIGDGQLWRLATALVVQDGGLAGTVFNLAALAIVGAVAEQVWGPGRWTAIALVSGLGAQLWGLLVQPVGAGNSVVIFGLAASMASVAIVSLNSAHRAAGIVCMAGAAVLLVLRDIHGGAAFIGAVTGLTLTPPAPASPSE